MVCEFVENAVFRCKICIWVTFNNLIMFFTNIENVPFCVIICNGYVYFKRFMKMIVSICTCQNHAILLIF